MRGARKDFQSSPETVRDQITLAMRCTARGAQHIGTVAQDPRAIPGPGSDGIGAQLEVSPRRVCRRAEHEGLRAGIVGDELWRPGGDEVGVTRIRDRARGMQIRDRRHDLGDGPGRAARGQRAADPEGELGLGHPHSVAGEAQLPTVRDDALGEQPAGEGLYEVALATGSGAKVVGQSVAAAPCRPAATEPVEGGRGAVGVVRVSVPKPPGGG